MTREDPDRLGALVVPLVVPLILAFVVLLSLAGCAVANRPIAPVRHAPFAPGLSCASKGCHATSHQHKPPYIGDCAKCHSLVSWRIVLYAHANDDFNTGMHGVIGCVRCHTEGTPPPDKDCAGCHSAPHGGWTDCRKCHLPLTWLLRLPVPTGHLSLLGGHSKLNCLDCHAQAKAATQPRTCVSCHGPHHGGLTDCGMCHDPANGWTPGAFDHSVFFRITGRHTKLQCTQCHPGGRFAGTSPACVSCHGTHHGGLTACSECHTTARFKPSTFRHSSEFNLAGGPHAKLACSRCHPGNLYAHVKGNTCLGCHGPQHGGLTRCTPCHASNGAVIYPFDHTPFFPLAGGPHANLACTSCHPGNDFVGARGKTCLTCHGPKHGGFTNCSQCHVANGAIASPLHHPAPIVLGAQHASRPCSLCHTGFVFTANRACSDCHTTPHVGPTDCLRCHRPTVWTELHFDHPATFHYPYAPSPSCLDCHPGRDYTHASCTLCH